MDETDRRIINGLQGGFPIGPRPYQDAANALGISEDDLLDRLRRLLDEGVLSRFGPMYDTERMGGGLTLAALSVPKARFDEVAQMVNEFPQVAHNYQRDHKLNMWFVVATEDPAEVARIIGAIGEKTGLAVHDMPKQREFFLELKLTA
jgi:DNA-binding Lrp family transcriptional regulator